MDMYAGSEQRTAETYMIPTSGSNPQLAYIPQIEDIDYVGNEVAPEFILDQGLYYPATNYYGYYSTGFESPGQWDGNNRVFGLDGQDLQYSGLQTESLPYVYYTPSYGYAQSPYSPYNAYTHGAVIGLDGSYVGTEQYGSTSTYQPQASSPAYIPIVVQPSTGATPNSTDDPLSVSTGVSVGSRHVHGGLKFTPLASVNTSANSQRIVSGNAHPETSQSSQISAKSAEGSVVNALTSKLSVTQGSSLNSATQVAQVRSSSGQSTHQLSHGRVPSIYNPLKVTLPSNDGFTHFGSNVHGWAAVDTFRPSLHHNGVLNSPTGSTNVLGDQNAHRPRTIRSRRQWVPSIIDGTHLPKSDDTDGQQNIIIDTDTYNRDDFQVNCPNAKFFVIKSYSEDDVHKSIKYNVWSSTPNGNKRLQSAYEDALRISPGQPRNCRIFLFFSVNASGQFCGVAEMIGPVDFNKDMSFWQQDKWTGSFPVKWHIIKDVPNTSFRHIILENNENKPVTNSRDTQEIPYLPGISMLNIFKGSLLRTSILDDFKFYEDRERIMQEEKTRVFGRSYNASQFLPAIFPVNRTNSAATQTKADGKPSHGSVSYNTNAEEGKLFSATEQPTKGGGKQPNGLVNHSKKIDGKVPNGRIEQPNSSRKTPDSAVNQTGEADGEPPNDTVHSPKSGTKQPDNAVDQSPKADNEHMAGSIDHPPKTGRTEIKPRDAVTIVGKPLKADRNAIKTKDLKSISDLSQNADTKDHKNMHDLSSTSDIKGLKSAGKDTHNSKDPNTMCTTVPDHEQVTQNGLVNQLRKADGKAPKSTVRQSLSSSGKASKSAVNPPPNGKPQNDAVHPPIVDSKKTNHVDQSSKPSGKQPSGSVDQPLNTDRGENNPPKEPVITNVEPFKADRNKIKVKDPNSMADQPSKADRKDLKNTGSHKDPKTVGRTGPSDEKYVRKESIQLNNKINAKADPAVYASAIDLKEGEVSSAGVMVNEIVTVGSMRIKVKGPSEPSSGIITVGTIPIDPKGLKVNQHGSLGSSHLHQK